MKRFSLFLCLGLCVVSLFSGCTSAPPTESPEPTPQPQANASSVLSASHPLVLLQSGQLVAVDPQSGQSAPLYTLKVGEVPSAVSEDSFKLSPSKKYVVWYSAGVGLIAYNIADKTSRVVFTPSDWFNSNPYFTFLPGQDVLVFVDNDGSVMRQVDLNNQQAVELPIPYPFGTVFLISPDGNSFLFVSGYGQDEQTASYMFTDKQLSQQTQFQSQADISDRYSVAWLPDSSGVVAIERDKEVVNYPRDNPENSKVFYTVEGDERITSIEGNDDILFISTADGNWHMVQGKTGELIARLPKEVVADLKRATLLPWYDQQFLIREVISPFPEERFNRLWKLTFRGEKEMIVPKYQETLVSSQVDDVQL